MIYRQFENPHELKKSALLIRLLPLDEDIEIRIDRTPLDEGGYSELISVASEILTDTQIEQIVSVPLTAQEIAKKADRQLVVDSIDAFIVSSGLVGKRLSNVNNNVDRDKLLQVICSKLHITDSSATIRVSTEYNPSKGYSLLPR